MSAIRRISTCAHAFRWAAGTDIGRCRQSNQDEVIVCPDVGFFAVSDGMGGLSYGEKASEYVRLSMTELMTTFVAQHQPQMDTAKAADGFAALVAQMSDMLFATGNADGLYSYGATFCGVWLLGENAIFVNLGDSRGYLLPKRKRLPRLVTEDQNIAAVLVKSGQLTREEAKHHPSSASLTAFVGMNAPAAPQCDVVDIRPGDRILLCSDGLYGMVEEREMARLMRSSRSAERVCQRLIGRANENGGRDNIAAVYLRIER